MTVIVTEPFSYANNAALEAAGWARLVSASEYNHVSVEQGSGAVVLDIDTSYSDGLYGIRRTFGLADGILPSTAYTVAMTATGVGVCNYGVVKAGPTLGSLVNSPDFGAPGTRTITTGIATSDASGNLIVFGGIGYTPVGYWDFIATLSIDTIVIDDGVTLPPYVSALPARGVNWDQIAREDGVIDIDGVPVGKTNGGLKFDPGEVWEPLPYDGDLIPDVNVYEMTGQRARFVGSFLPVGPEKLQLYVAGAAVTISRGVGLVLPLTPGSILPLAKLSLNVRVTWPYVSGGTIAVTFPRGFWNQYRFETSAGGGLREKELLVASEILAVPTAAGQVPYYITTKEPGA